MGSGGAAQKSHPPHHNFIIIDLLVTRGVRELGSGGCLACFEEAYLFVFFQWWG
ncbi:hypothetical protein P186_2798 [Pyrobaculum ferrireducens]|uniref:Uncharacterized protein n=1 Tax=Pyrobaculum ferrireducens TaxID=1104324 RepID=G7VF09_9CREN|nr:hypothetical protein P186_2798 [Pyrobaculum ferrireducens]